jgi:transcription factor C subunit 6
MPIGGDGGGGPDSSAIPTPSVSCDFGPFGNQTKVNLNMLGTQKLCKIALPTPLLQFFLPSLIDSAIAAMLTAQFMPESRAHVFNAGASVWGIDWCPIHPDDRPRKNMFVWCRASLTSRVEPDCSYNHYLAVAPLSSRTHSPEIGIKVPRPERACIQLWSLGPGVGESGDDKGAMRCNMILCIDSGPALELKWCPLPSHDSVCPESLCNWLLGFMRQPKAVRASSSPSEKTRFACWSIRRRLPVGVCGSVPTRSWLVCDGHHLW